MPKTNWKKHQFTKEQLIKKALEHDPTLKKRPNLENEVIAGMVQLKNGLYMEVGDCLIMKEEEKNENSIRMGRRCKPQ